MNNYWILFCLVIVSFISCSKSNVNRAKNYDNLILGNWQLIDASEIVNENETKNKSENLHEKLQGDLIGSKLISEGYLLNIFSDSSYNLIQTYNPEIGKWRFLNNKTLQFGDNKIIIEGIENEYSQKILMATIIDHNNNKTKAKFISKGFVLEDYKLDPYHPLNNQWRIPPRKSESYEEIRKRLTNYLLHNALIFKVASDQKRSEVSFEFSQGIIKIYKRGIGIVSEDLIHKSWEKTFFDSKDAMKAYYLFQTYLENGVYRGNKSSMDWMKEDYLILLKLYEQINSKAKPEEEEFARTYYSF